MAGRRSRVLSDHQVGRASLVLGVLGSVAVGESANVGRCGKLRCRLHLNHLVLVLLYDDGYLGVLLLAVASVPLFQQELLPDERSR